MNWGEPFRVFFPLGALASIAGVLLWPLFYAGIWPFPPHLQHPRILIFGFGLAMVTGFLGTAWPRFVEAVPLRRGEVLVLVGCWAAAQAGYLTHRLPWGDLATAATVALLAGMLAIRGWKGSSGPPPGMLLALIAVVLAGGVALVWGLVPAGAVSPAVARFLQLVAWQGMLLLPLLGVGSHLAARFFETEAVEGRRGAAGVWLAAGLVLVSFALEAAGWVRLGNGIRFGALALWGLLAAPCMVRGRAPGTRAWALRVALGFAAGTFALRAMWPGPAYAMEHLFFISGAGLAMLVVADRVRWGHAERLGSLPARSVAWRWVVGLVVMAAATRASADFKASILVSHHIYAALTWAGVAVWWLWRGGPGKKEQSARVPGAS